MEQWINNFTSGVVAIFFAISWAYYAISINKLKHKVKKLEKDKRLRDLT